MAKSPVYRRSPSEEFTARAKEIKRKHSGEIPTVRSIEPVQHDIDDPDTFDELKEAEVMTKLRIHDTVRPPQSDPIAENFPSHVREQMFDLMMAAQSDRVEFHRMYRELQEQDGDTILFVCLALYLSGRSLIWRGKEWKVTLCKEMELQTESPVVAIRRARMSHPADQQAVEECVPLVDVLAGLKR